MKPKHPGKISSLFEAIEAGDLESMRQFIRQGSDLEEISDERWGVTPLLVASELRNPKAMKVLLEAGADPNYEGETGTSPVHLATADLACLNVILEAGGDPNLEAEDYITPLMLIRRDEDLPKTLMLLEAGADPTKMAREGVTALGEAEQYGAREVARELRRWIKKSDK